MKAVIKLWMGTAGFKRELLVILGYLAITVVFTSPAIFYLGSMMMGEGTHGLVWSWNFWWFKSTR